MARQIRTTAEATATAPEPEQPSEAAQATTGPSVIFINNVINRELRLQDGSKYKFSATSLTTSDPKLIENLTAYAAQPGSMVFIQTAE